MMMVSSDEGYSIKWLIFDDIDAGPPHPHGSSAAAQFVIGFAGMLAGRGQVRQFVDCPLGVSAGWIVNMGAKRIAWGLWRTMIVTHRYLGIAARVPMLFCSFLALP